MSSEYLPSGELHQLTGYARAGQQREWLTRNGIPHRVDESRAGVCRVIVSRVHVQAWLEGRTVVHSKGLNLAGIK